MQAATTAGSALDSFANSLLLTLPSTPRRTPHNGPPPPVRSSARVAIIMPGTPLLDSPSSPYTPSPSSPRLLRIIKSAVSLSSPGCQRMVIDDFNPSIPRSKSSALARMSPTMAQVQVQHKSAYRDTRHSNPFASSWNSDDDVDSDSEPRPLQGRLAMPIGRQPPPPPGVCRKLFPRASDGASPVPGTQTFKQTFKPRRSLPVKVIDDDDEWLPLASARIRFSLPSKSNESLRLIDRGERGMKRKR